MPNFFIVIAAVNKLLLLAILLFVLQMWTSTALADAISTQPKIGLALSGGSARGAAHVGVIRELEKQNIRIDYIAGAVFGWKNHDHL